MKERPILFSGAMVRAILEGRKTQSRRVMKVQPPADGYELATCISTTGDKRAEGRQHWLKRDGYRVLDSNQPYFSCPYGHIGDRLWVRETFTIDRVYKDGGIADVGFEYRATARDSYTWPDYHDDLTPPKWKPAIHMPRIASRITLEITNIRVERLQDISEADCEVELGVAPHSLANDAHSKFRDLWQSISGPKSWDANPWVWVISFKQVKPLGE